ncbi:nucleoside hydrolase [Dendronalium sp. ChiSLP03b]|uniref:nucleoside hydrolase n=1 Tax=Dendronalium sp. ChiSLP03b TaxID=3075381 RepID=UPI002AD4C1EB|nr:nucleoside hydrolase [Dendronalium sp. ChiSLP03b]MDZ8207881.1 nucleoside hydrolase [Dendronalium sp. ChiSLP03b]
MIPKISTLEAVVTKVITGLVLGAALVVEFIHTQPVLGADFRTSNQPIPLIVDDDGSQDGLIALAYMLQNPKFQVKAITISHGMAHPQIFGEKLLKALNRLDVPEIPVGVGSEVPLAGSNAFPEVWRADADGFYTPYVPSLTEIPSGTVDERNAAQLIIDTVKQSSEPVAILATGSLTNIAQALRQEPSIENKIAAVEIMGGAVNVEGNLTFHTDPILAQNQVAEFNIWADPVAAQEVFSSGLPISLTPLDATNPITFTAADRDAWKAVGTPESILASQLMDYSLSVVAGGVENPVQVWDLVAAINLSESSFCNEVPLHLEVVTNTAPSETQGQTVKVNGLPSNVNVCLNASFNNISFSTHEVFKSKTVPEPVTVFGSLAFSTLLAVRELIKCKKQSQRT